MRIVSFIPLRSGSKSIPLKNIKPIAGKPLAQWVIDVSNNSKYINDTFISIDDKIISDNLINCKIFWRSKETATDEASSEIALIEFCDQLNPEDLIVFIQATSPLLKSDEIDKGIEMVLSGDYESVLSVVRQKRFIWNNDSTPTYDLNNRHRRQEWDGYLVENGAFYINRVKDILKSRCRISGKIGMVECSLESYYEIDEPFDWIIVENLLNNKKYEIRT
jgi:CMP-N-acetylneuraminic acid synthetase